MLRQCLKLNLKSLNQTWEHVSKIWASELITSLKWINRLTVVQTCFFHLCHIAKVKPFPNFSDTQKIIMLFSRLDYCNSLNCGINKSILDWLKLVQNAADGLLTRTRKYEHITPILASQNWLPVKYRIEFKILLMVFKSIINRAPAYLAYLLVRHVPSRSLRSSDLALLTVPRTRSKYKGDQVFAVIGPNLWNKLLLEIRRAPTLTIF